MGSLIKRSLPVLVIGWILLCHAAMAADVKKVENKDPLFDWVKSSNNVMTKKEINEEVEMIKGLDEVTGIDWLQSSLRERSEHVMASMVRLNMRGVDLHKTQNDYCNAIEEKLISDPNLYAMNLTDILVQVVREKEPWARAGLDLK